MKFNILLCGAVLAIGTLSTGAFAAEADTTCAEFTAMDAAGQAKIVADMGTTHSQTAKVTSDTNSADVPALSAGIAVSACQATPTATLKDALSKAGYSSGESTMAK